MVAEHPGLDPALSCYSFAFRPLQARPRFLARTARMLGCVPHIHFKRLVEGETVTLDNGNIVKPEMVMGKADKAQDFMAIFLPSTEYIPSFLE